MPNNNLEQKTDNKAGYEEEIHLIEVWLALVRNKWVILGVTVFFVLAALSYSLLRDTRYLYRTTIELARTDDGPLEDSDAVQSLLEDTLIPLMLAKMQEENDSSSYSPPSASAVASEGSDRLLNIDSEGKKTDKDKIETLHDLLVEELENNHNTEIKNVTNELEAEVQSLQNKLQRLEPEKSRLEKHIKEVKSRVDNARSLMEQEPLEASGAGTAMNQLLLLTQIDEAQERFYSLNERLHQSLPSKEDEHKAEIARIETKIDNLKYTKEKMLALRLEPVNTSSALIMATSLILGILIGVFCAILVDFVRKLKLTMQQT